VGHDGRHHAARFADSQHVLSKHQIRFFARRRTPAPAIALRKLHIALRIVLTERRIGNDPIKPFEFAALPVEGVQERVFQFDIGAAYAVQEHIDFADGPCRRIIHLAAEAQVGRVAAGLLDIFAADDQHAAGTACGVVDAHPRGGVQNADHHSDDIAGGIEISTFLTG